MRGAAISEAARTRTADIVSALAAMGSLSAPSRLPGWSRLTVACHLRYGAIASRRMTTRRPSRKKDVLLPWRALGRPAGHPRARSR